MVILDFMAVDCANCHYVQGHIEDSLDSWQDSSSDYPVVALSIGAWYGYESFDWINDSFGDPGSDKHMRWPVANGATDSIILDNGSRGDLVEHYAAQNLPIVYVIDHEGYAVAKEGTGTPLDGWSSFDKAVDRAIEGDAESLRFGIEKADRSFSGVFVIGLFLGVLVYTCNSSLDICLAFSAVCSFVAPLATVSTFAFESAFATASTAILVLAVRLALVLLVALAFLTLLALLAFLLGSLAGSALAIMGAS